MSRPRIEPGDVWFVDFDPVRGREQDQDRPALVVSSRFHLDLTAGELVSVLPLTSVERPGWLHRVPVGAGRGWVITEQIRTVSAGRFRRRAPETHRHQPRQRLGVDVGDRDAAERDAAGVRWVRAADQQREGGLARAGRPDEHDPFPAGSPRPAGRWSLGEYDERFAGL